MPSRERSWGHQALRQFRHSFTASHFGRPHHSRKVVEINVSQSRAFNVWSQREHFFLWIRGRQRRHFGPKSRVPDLFRRRDYAYFNLEAPNLQRYTAPPHFYHDLLDAASKVGVVEERIGYTFKDKMTCIAALKTSGDDSPLYFKGVRHEMDQNNRLALLGDRILSLALCEIWFATGRSPVNYNQIRNEVETRSALSIKGRALNMHKCIIIPNQSLSPTPDDIAETFEAILGAVYVDSGYEIHVIKNVIRNLGLDSHRLLKMRRNNGTQTEIEKGSHALNTNYPLARQLEASKSHSLISESVKKLANLWTKFFNPGAKSAGENNIASTSSFSIREGVDSAQAYKLLNDTKPVSDESLSDLMQPCAITSHSLQDVQTDTKIESKISTEAESQGATTVIAKIPAMPPRGVIPEAPEKPTALVNKDAHLLQVLSNTAEEKRWGEKEIKKKAFEDALAKANKMASNLRKQGSQFTFDDVCRRTWKKVQRKMRHDIWVYQTARRKEREQAQRLALEAQQKADKASAKQKAMEASLTQKQAKESFTALKKVDVAQKKAVESFAPQKPASETSTMQTKKVEASVQEKKENGAFAAQKKVKETPTAEQKTRKVLTTQRRQDEVPMTRKKRAIALSVIQKKLDKASTKEKQAKQTSDSQKKVEEAAPTQKRAGKASTKKKNLAVLESEKERKDIMPTACKQQISKGITESKHHTLVEGESDTIKALIGILTNATTQGGENIGAPLPSLSLPLQTQRDLQDSNASDRKVGTVALSSKPQVGKSPSRDYESSPKAAGVSRKSRLQMELEKPEIIESEVESPTANLTEKDKSKPNEPAELDSSQQALRVSDVKSQASDVGSNTPLHNSAEDTHGQQSRSKVQKEVRAEAAVIDSDPSKPLSDTAGDNEKKQSSADKEAAQIPSENGDSAQKEPVKMNTGKPQE